jgi:hypothetical protein
MSTIIKSSGGIAYETDTGYESQEDWPDMHGTDGLFEMLDEITRILTINGDADRVRRFVDATIQRTQQALAA